MSGGLNEQDAGCVIGQLLEALARIDKARAEHWPTKFLLDYEACETCGEDVNLNPDQQWPCPTVRALDGTDD